MNPRCSETTVLWLARFPQGFQVSQVLDPFATSRRRNAHDGRHTFSRKIPNSESTGSKQFFHPRASPLGNKYHRTSCSTLICRRKFSASCCCSRLEIHRPTQVSLQVLPNVEVQLEGRSIFRTQSMWHPYSLLLLQ